MEHMYKKKTGYDERRVLNVRACQSMLALPPGAGAVQPRESDVDATTRR